MAGDIIEINGKKFDIPTEVADLIYMISKERDNYRAALKNISDPLFMGRHIMVRIAKDALKSK